jgi:hypothetical protein
MHPIYGNGKPIGYDYTLYEEMLHHQNMMPFDNKSLPYMQSAAHPLPPPQAPVQPQQPQQQNVKNEMMYKEQPVQPIEGTYYYSPHQQQQQQQQQQLPHHTQQELYYQQPYSYNQPIVPSGMQPNSTYLRNQQPYWHQ